MPHKREYKTYLGKPEFGVKRTIKKRRFAKVPEMGRNFFYGKGFKAEDEGVTSIEQIQSVTGHDDSNGIILIQDNETGLTRVDTFEGDDFIPGGPDDQDAERKSNIDQSRVKRFAHIKQRVPSNGGDSKKKKKFDEALRFIKTKITTSAIRDFRSDRFVVGDRGDFVSKIHSRAT